MGEVHESMAVINELKTYANFRSFLLTKNTAVV